MENIIFGASILAAFVAGMVALFAPCCVTVLLPTYLASVFRDRKNVLKMTLIYTAGIAVVLVPIGLGAAGLARVFRSFHMEMYFAGGMFMIILALFSLFGKSVSFFPRLRSRASSGLKSNHPKSVFLLGIFSGAATSCCAPVLAGAVTLAALSGAFWKALIVTLAYVLGMTAPLFVAAYFVDRYKLGASRLAKSWTIPLNKSGKTYVLTASSLLASIIFLVMGGVMIWMAFSGNEFWSPDTQAALGEKLNTFSTQIIESLDIIPDSLWGIAIFSAFAFFVYKIMKKNDQ